MARYNEDSANTIDELVELVIHKTYLVNYRFKLSDSRSISTDENGNNRTIWNLVESNGGYNGRMIHLSAELGEALEKVWTKKERDWMPGYFDRTGSVSLLSLLVRLGRKDVKKLVEMEVSNQKVRDDNNRKNYAKRELVRLAEECKKHLVELGLSTGVTLEDLLKLQ